MGVYLLFNKKLTLTLNDCLINFFLNKGFTKVVEEASHTTIRLVFEARNKEDKMEALSYNNLTFLGRYELVIDTHKSILTFRYYLPGSFISQNKEDTSNSFYSSIPFIRKLKLEERGNDPFFSSYHELIDYENLVDSLTSGKYPFSLLKDFVDCNYESTGSHTKKEYLVACYYSRYDLTKCNNLDEVFNDLEDKVLEFLYSQECKEYTYQLLSFMFERVQLA